MERRQYKEDSYFIGIRLHSSAGKNYQVDH